MAAKNVDAPDVQKDQPEVQVEFGRATVARGRTVRSGGKAYGPGAEIDLPVADIVKLRKSGFLITPGGVEAERGNGPTFINAGA